MLILRAMIERNIESNPEIADFIVDSLKLFGRFFHLSSTYFAEMSFSVRLACSCRLKPRFVQNERGINLLRVEYFSFFSVVDLQTTEVPHGRY
jgi:hypothetical protein